MKFSPTAFLLSTIDSISLPFHFIAPSTYSPSDLLLSTIDSVSLSFHFILPYHSSMNMDDSMMSDSASSSSFCVASMTMAMFMDVEYLHYARQKPGDDLPRPHVFPLMIPFYRLSFCFDRRPTLPESLLRELDVEFRGEVRCCDDRSLPTRCLCGGYRQVSNLLRPLRERQVLGGAKNSNVRNVVARLPRLSWLRRHVGHNDVFC